MRDIRSCYYEVDVGEPLKYRNRSGNERLINAVEITDRHAVLLIDDRPVKLELGHLRDPSKSNPPGEMLHIVDIGGLTVGLEATRECLIENVYEETTLNLKKDVRLFIREKAISPPLSYTFPTPAYDWNYGDNWMTKTPYGFHLGIDLYASRGSDVVAVCDGIIQDVRFYDPSIDVEDYWGMMVSILGDDGVIYNYMHFDRLAPGIQPGKRIRGGEYMGPVGKSGFESMPYGPHLHFEMMMLRKPELFRFVFLENLGQPHIPLRVLPYDTEGFVVNPLLYLNEWYGKLLYKRED